MDTQNFKEVKEFIFYLLTELSSMPIEDFIKEINDIMLNNKNSNLPKEKLMHYLIIANGLSAMKSNYLINMNIFI